MGNVDTAKKVGSGPQLIWKRKSAVFDTEVKGGTYGYEKVKVGFGGSASIKPDCSDAESAVSICCQRTWAAGETTAKRKEKEKWKEEKRNKRQSWWLGEGERRRRRKEWAVENKRRETNQKTVSHNIVLHPSLGIPIVVWNPASEYQYQLRCMN